MSGTSHHLSGSDQARSPLQPDKVMKFSPTDNALMLHPLMYIYVVIVHRYYPQ
ncbi:hypothetical protein BDZ94DRAFT_1267181 [Collybia nuda]|uniref:Uncharacterized protein n=1 Tax=Collybia nuda TaxID=64659 RepID=A0A9P6CBU6_9AGAR|nr:hypothetical protein BDZ94DRAFT_1267181 [Collybia nuda]